MVMRDCWCADKLYIVSVDGGTLVGTAEVQKTCKFICYNPITFPGCKIAPRNWAP